MILTNIIDVYKYIPNNWYMLDSMLPNWICSAVFVFHLHPMNMPPAFPVGIPFLIIKGNTGKQNACPGEAGLLTAYVMYFKFNVGLWLDAKDHVFLIFDFWTRIQNSTQKHPWGRLRASKGLWVKFHFIGWAWRFNLFIYQEWIILQCMLIIIILNFQ